MPNQILHVDAIVVGAGMVGLTIASLLAKQGRPLAIIDRNEPARFNIHEPYEARVTAVSPGSKAIFEYVNAWPLMQEKRVSQYETMVVWDESSDARIQFNSYDINHVNLGFIVENRVIQSSLYESLRSSNGVHWQFNCKLENVVTAENHVEIILDNGQMIRAGLLIGADGHQSSVRKYAGILFCEKYYQQQGIVARVQTEHAHQNTAWQRFLSTGPLALLPLNNSECSIVWSANDDYATQLMQLDEQKFEQALTQASESKLGEITLCSKRASFPLLSGQAKSMVQTRIALVGDAAHALHPLAGQGANLGFTDAAVLADVLANTERDIGSYKVLRKYERARAGETLVMQHAMNALVAIFCSTSTPVITARNFALNSVDKTQSLKKFFMRHAMGLNKDRPVFAR